MKEQIAIIDYGMGNIHSIQKKLSRLGATSIVTNNSEEIKSCGKIILPGVGHFARAMHQLHQLNLIKILNNEVLNNKKPILGICLGMQLMASRSAEGGVNGLGWLTGEVIKFNISDTLKYKVPHTGWNQVEIKKSSALMNQIADLSEFYFVHAYHYVTRDRGETLNESNFEYNFVSAVEKNNIYGVQYHPEKSHDVGEQLLKNFIQI